MPRPEAQKAGRISSTSSESPYKELNETAVWLRLILGCSILSQDKIVAVLAENEELSRIIAASIKTAGGFER